MIGQRDASLTDVRTDRERAPLAVFGLNSRQADGHESLNYGLAGRAGSAGCVYLRRRWHRRILAARLTIRARPHLDQPGSQTRHDLQTCPEPRPDLADLRFASRRLKRL